MHWDENGFEVCHSSCLVLALDVKKVLKLKHITSHFRNAICLGSTVKSKGKELKPTAQS